MKTINVKLNSNTYKIIIGNNILKDVGKFFDVNRKMLIVTDDNIPTKYIETVKNKIKSCKILTIKHGEKNKNFNNYKKILSTLVKNNFTRTDAIIAIGGGMIGDMAGFAAITFMRGIDFYNIPTTLLSQVDSSIGGKTAIDFDGVKNIVGCFYQPKCVLIDIDTLKTLPIRELRSGFVESIKMAATFDKNFFYELKKCNNILKDATKIVFKSIQLKKEVVEKDEKEKNIRKSLNFGHTIGHAIEETAKLKYTHGECVGMGMLYFSGDAVKKEIANLLKKHSLPTDCNVDKKKVLKLISLDKKASGDKISIIQVDTIGKFKIKKVGVFDIEKMFLNK